MIDPYVPERGNPGYQALHYDLELDYAVASNHLDGRARIRLSALETLDRVSLDLVRLRVSKVSVGGRATRWSHRSGKVHVHLDRPLAQGREATVEVRYAGNPRPAASTWGPVGWEELEDGVLVAAQPSGASTWFPCNDVARQKASFGIDVTVPNPYRAVANGVLRSTRTHGSATTWSYAQEEPTSPYLMALHVGRYEQHAVATTPVSISGVVAPVHRHAFDAAFGRLPQMMKTFVDRFGPYPLAAGYTVVLCSEELEIPVEAQGQATFGTNHLAHREERLVAHELAHQWFGNSVTAAAWRDIWLHEGFACYAEWIWSQASGGKSADALAREHHGRLRRLPQDLVLADPGPRDMFDDRVYKRGALTLHALRGELGDGLFFDVLRRWTSTNRHGVVTTDAFIALASEVVGRPMDALFDAWLQERRLPALM